MNRLKPSLFSYLAKTTVLLLYVCFFIVQLFFSVDFSYNPNSTSSHFLYKDAKATHHILCIKKANNAKDKKQSIHLSKRFEPIGLLACNLFLIKPLVCNISPESFKLSSNIFIPASFLHSQSFRGPPIVA